MSNITDKIAYTARAIDDIQAALEERGIDMNGVALMLYGNVIRSIKATNDEVDEEGYIHSPYTKLLDNIIKIDFPELILKNNIRFNDIWLIKNDAIIKQEHAKVTMTHDIEQPVTIMNINNIQSMLYVAKNEIPNIESIIVHENDLIIQEVE